MVIQRMNNVLVKHSKVLFGIFTAVIIVSFVWFFTPGIDGSLLFGGGISDKTEYGTCFQKKRPMSVADIRKFSDDPYSALMRKEKIIGVLAVPIIIHNRSIGVITIYTSKPKIFSQSEIDLLSTFASQASIAIENARLYADMKEQYMSMVMALAAAIEAKDSYTHGHSTKVMEYAVKIGKEIGLDEDQVETVKSGWYTVHKIPDSATPDRIMEVFMTAIKEKNYDLYHECIDPARRETETGEDLIRYHWDRHQERFHGQYVHAEFGKPEITVVKGFDEKSKNFPGSCDFR